MLNIILTVLLISILFYTMYRLRQVEKRARQMDEFVAILGQLTAICNISVTRVRELDAKNETTKKDLVEFQQAMAEFALTVTDFMDKVRDAFAGNKTITRKDDKLN